MKRVLLVKYGEIALRKGNRAIFERGLADTIQKQINDKTIKVTREQGRLLVEDSRGDICGDVNLDVIEKIRRIFGITAICVSLKLDDASIGEIKKAALESIKNKLASSEGLGEGDTTFKVETKRSDKRYPMTSREISAAVGEYVLGCALKLNHPNLKVDVHNPDVTIWVEIRNSAYVYTETVKCESGLPYGTTGKGVLLLSGGIDSPVAGYLMARRGVEIVPVYFHSPPYTSERAKDKVLDLLEQLSSYIGVVPLHVVPFTEIQLYIYNHMPRAKLTLFLKRAMIQIASMVAEKEKANCLITGDSVGQVASQTTWSIAAVDTAAGDYTILRPLAAMDKQMIIEQGMKIGTYEISIRPYDDCCTIFVPKFPEVKPNASAIAKIEAKHSVLQELYIKAFEGIECIMP